MFVRSMSDACEENETRFYFRLLFKFVECVGVCEKKKNANGTDTANRQDTRRRSAMHQRITHARIMI